MQQALNREGYSLDVDGGFGKKTLAALMDYQRRVGMTPDGVAGSKTWASLGVQSAQDRLADLEKGYTPSRETQDAKRSWEELAANRPGDYTSPYTERMEELLRQMEGRGPFAYDPSRDDTFQRYARLYQRQGQTAMEDALGQAAGLTGGYDSTYAQQAGQQEYGRYMQELAALVPQLQQNAWDRYESQEQALLDQYKLLQGQDASAYKTRKDGSKYKAWRCQEAAKHGSPHTDKAGNQIGCTGASIRNEDATHIMFLVTKELKLRQTKITKNLTSIIESIIAMDTTGTDIEKLKTQIATIEDKRTKLIDIYMSGDISKDEFSAARSKCDAEIAELQSVIDSIDKQQAMIRQQQELVQEIRDAINEIVCGVEYDDEFYKHILDKMVVNDKDNIDVYLNLLPMKWSYTVAKASKKALAPERNISGASVPMSVSKAFSSGYGMEYR